MLCEAWWDANSNNLLNSIDQSPDIYIEPYNRASYEEASVSENAHIYGFAFIIGYICRTMERFFCAVEIIWHFHNSLWQSINNKQKKWSSIFQKWTELLGNLAVSGIYSPEIVAAFNQICQILTYFLKHIANGTKIDLQ